VSISYGPLQEDEFEQAFLLRSRAFGGPITPDLERPRLPDDDVFVARLGSEVVGTASVARFGQVLGGTVVPMGGITGVAVAPQASGRGVAKRLMCELLDRMTESGLVISTLSPSTSPLYRAVGYESAGVYTKRTLPLKDLVRAEPARVDASGHVAVAEAPPSAYRDVRDQEQEAMSPGVHHRVLVARVGERPIAFGVVANREGSDDRRAWFDLDLVDAFGEPAGLSAIASLLAASGTIAGDLHTTLDFDDLAVMTDRPERLRTTKQDPWMSRLLDVRTALSGRSTGGFEGELHLAVSDPQIANNNGRFVLRCTGGETLVEEGGSGHLSVSINDLSSMFTGFRSPASLGVRGRLGDPTDQDIAALGRVFAAPYPSMIDSF